MTRIEEIAAEERAANGVDAEERTAERAVREFALRLALRLNCDPEIDAFLDAGDEFGVDLSQPYVPAHRATIKNTEE